VIRGSLSHLDLTVRDLSRSVRFYERVLGRLGYEPAPEIAGGAPCWITKDSAGGTFGIALVAAKPESAAKPHDRYAPGLHHVAFHADSRADVDTFYAFLRGIGASILDAPAEYEYTPGYYAVFFADPDGLKLEVVHEPQLRGRAG
jgi:catechol 2,3-dioxygenase-like lactoylglutathione lyase family enzyme